MSITVLSDWGLQQFPGVFIDDIVVSTGEGTTSFEDDADPMDGWAIPGAPQDERGRRRRQCNDWVRRGGFGIKEGAAITTPDSLFLGFGFEGITGTRDAQRGDGPGRSTTSCAEQRVAVGAGHTRPAPTVVPEVSGLDWGRAGEIVPR